MPSVLVEITRFVDEHFPGFVECVLVDAEGQRHSFVEKVPVVASANLWSTSSYPQPGLLGCKVQEAWRAPDGRSLVRVSTKLPWHIESTAGAVEFVLSAAQVQNDESDA